MRINLCGEQHHKSKLTEKQVIAIKKALLEDRFYGQIADLARKYGVTSANINEIKSGRTWSHVKVDASEGA